VERDAGNESQ